MKSRLSLRLVSILVLGVFIGLGVYLSPSQAGSALGNLAAAIKTIDANKARIIKLESQVKGLSERLSILEGQL